MKFNLELHPRFNYGRSKHRVLVNAEGANFTCEGHTSITMHLATSDHGHAVERLEVDRALRAGRGADADE